MQTEHDVLPSVPRRILVAGTSGSGKTALARQVAAMAGVPHTEIDALFHGPGWTPRDSFMVEVAALATQPGWVTEWQYGIARSLLLQRADLMVWLDLPLAVVMGRVVRRTVQRRLGRTVLWNDNQEPPLRTLLTDPDHIVRWAWWTRHATAKRVAGAATSRQDLTVVRLTSQYAVDEWLSGPLLNICQPGSITEHLDGITEHPE